MTPERPLLELYYPPEGFLLQSLVGSTYRVDWAFLEEELLPAALGVTCGLNRANAFRADLQSADCSSVRQRFFMTSPAQAI